MTEPTPPAARPSRRPLLLILGGCALLLLCGLVASGAAGAYFFATRARADTTQPAVEYILDASPRMSLADAGGTRLAVAQGVLAEVIRPASPDLTAGLRVFGTGAQPQACQDTNLIVPLAPSNQSEISSRVTEVQAGAAADAAMGEAMIAAIRDLSTTEGPHTLVVVTGGADSCNAQAGQLIAAEAARAGVTLQTFVVGYQVPEEEAEALRGLVDDAGDSTYLNALDADELRQILNAIQKYVDNPTTTFPTVTLGTPAAVAVGPTAGPGTAAVSPTEGAGPAPTEGAGPDATAGPTGYVSQTACDHPYLPLRQGATWTYATSEGNYDWTVSAVTGDLEAATAVMDFTMDGVVITYHWNCTGDGMVSYDFGNVAASGEGAVADFKVTASEGTWLPPVELLVPGYTWVNNYTMETTVGGGGQSFSSVTDVSQNFSVAGFASTTSEAGTFETLSVNSTGTYAATMTGLPGFTTSSTGTTQFAYGVGMVRQESSSSGVSSTTTLVSYSIP